MGRLGRFGSVDAVWEEMVRTGERWRRVWFLEPAEVEGLRPWGFELSDLQAVVGAFKQPRGVSSPDADPQPGSP